MSQGCSIAQSQRLFQESNVPWKGKRSCGFVRSHRLSRKLFLGWPEFLRWHLENIVGRVLQLKSINGLAIKHSLGITICLRDTCEVYFGIVSMEMVRKILFCICNRLINPFIYFQRGFPPKWVDIRLG